MGKSFPFTLIGFSDEQVAHAAAKRVGEVLNEIAEQLGLLLYEIDGITIAHDYDAALAALDRGLQMANALTRSNDEAAAGCAMTPCVLRNGQVKSHIVFHAAVVHLIDFPTKGVSGRYIVAHEAAHAHEHTLRNHKLPGTLLQPVEGKSDDVFRFKVAEACWVEYAACYFSATIHPDQTRILEQPLIQTLSVAGPRIAAAKRAWLQDRDYERLGACVFQLVADLMKYASYLLGHAIGLGQSTETIAPDMWKLIVDNDWFMPSFVRLREVLAQMMGSIADWDGMHVFEPLKELVRSCLNDCGIEVFNKSTGQIVIRVHRGRIPV